MKQQIPSERFALLATSLTVAIMFSLTVTLLPWLQSLRTSSKVIAGVVGVIGSAGIYKLIASRLFALFRRSLWVRKKVLGSGFLEGTWVGGFPHSGAYHYTVEFFDQESGETKIFGREFQMDGATYATWTSYASAIDLENRKIIYAYSCDVFATKNQQQGLGVFDLVSKKKRDPAQILDGYAADLIDGKKDVNREYKISDVRVPDESALAKARLLVPGGRSAPHSP